MTSVSIVTPSFNQAEYLPECIESVRDQTHNILEHFVFDPGSTDGSREIASEYPSVTLVAEPDEGQADAVAQGMRRAQGDIVGWLNSDDIYIDNEVVSRVVARFAEPDKPDIVYGTGEYIDEVGNHIKDAYVNAKPDTLPRSLQYEVGILQPTLFFRRNAFDRLGYPRTDLNFAMDYDLWIRATKAGLRIAHIAKPLAGARYYPDNKTMGQRGASYREVLALTTQHFGAPHVRWARRLADFRINGLDGVLATPDGRSAMVEQETARVLNAFTFAWQARHKLQQNADVEPYKETHQFLQKHGLIDSNHVSPAELWEGGDAQSYAIQGRVWKFDSAWHSRVTRSAELAFDGLSGRHSNVDCVIVVGNRSITDFPRSPNLELIATDRDFSSPQDVEQFAAVAVGDSNVLERSAPMLNLVTNRPVLAFWWASYVLCPGPQRMLLPTQIATRFGLALEQCDATLRGLYLALMLASHRGYRRTVVIGRDHQQLDMIAKELPTSFDLQPELAPDSEYELKTLLTTLG